MHAATYPLATCLDCRADVPVAELADHVCTWPGGTVYLLHFDEPIGNLANRYGSAQHYTGTAVELAARLAVHRAGNGAAIMAAVHRAGIGWRVARTWPGGRVAERALKRRGGARRHCPLCRAARTAGGAS
jgi:putative endonuclease